MISSKMITCALTYKCKNKNIQEAQLKQYVEQVVNSDDFTTFMHIITHEATVTTEVNNNNVEALVTMFVTFEQTNYKLTRLLKLYIDSKLTNIVTLDGLNLKLLQRRVY